MGKHISCAMVALALLLCGCGAVDVIDSSNAKSQATFASCATYASQSEAQKAWEAAGKPRGRDGDGDGLVCESAGRDSKGSAKTKDCRLVRKVVAIGISTTRSPETVAHFEDAKRRGYPEVLTIDRAGADLNREQSLAGIPTAAGKQRDEYPPAISKEGGIAEIGPSKGRRADVRLIDETDNSRSGASMGVKLRQYCDGQKFMLVGY